jgi:hypothetical protein
LTRKNIMCMYVFIIEPQDCQSCEKFAY